MQHNFGFTQSEWIPPHDLPDLSDAKVIAFDLETYDPELKRPYHRRGCRCKWLEGVLPHKTRKWLQLGS